MDKSTEALIQQIRNSFSGVTLGFGISWREADVIDDYGSKEERAMARAKDEKEDWTKVPHELIGEMRYNAVLCFMNPKGLRFYIPAVMIHNIMHHKECESLIIDSLTYTVCNPEIIPKLKEVLTKEQVTCMMKYLEYCLARRDYFDDNGIKEALKMYQ